MKLERGILGILFYIVSLCFPLLTLHPMNFEFGALGKSNKIEVGLHTGFAGGEVRGVFPVVRGEIDFKVESLPSTRGVLQLDARSLQFGHYKVAGDVHSMDWLDSIQFPQISFTLLGLQGFYSQKKSLVATASGRLRMKNRNIALSFPLSIQYYRAERRKVDGISGDLLVLKGETTISRSEMGINPGMMMDTVMDPIKIKINLVGGSLKVRPFLPSALFERDR